jgi:hypothetical protein
MRLGPVILIFMTSTAGCGARTGAERGDGVGHDASQPSGDSVAHEDGSAECPNPDRDRDGYAALECGGIDCDDLSAEVHPGAVETSEWTVEVIDVECRGDGLITMDEAGHAHVVAECPGVTYWTNASGTWESELLPLVRPFADLEVPFGLEWAAGVHLLAYVRDGPDVVYARRDESAWSRYEINMWSIREHELVVLDGAPCVVGTCDEAELCVDCRSPDGSWTSFARVTNGGQTCCTAASVVRVGNRESLRAGWGAFYPGVPVGPYGHLFEQTEDGWFSENTPVSMDAIAADSLGRIHVAYFGTGEPAHEVPHQTRYAMRDGGVWYDELVYEQFEDGGDEQDADLVVTDRDVSVVAVRGRELVVVKAGGSWQGAIVDPDYAAARGGAGTPRLAARGADVHLVYQGGRDAGLRYARRSPAEGIDNDCDGVAE